MMKRASIFLIALFVALFAFHGLCNPGPPVFGMLNKPVITGGSIILSGSAYPPSLWVLQQSPDRAPNSWVPAPQQPVFSGINFSCTNQLESTHLFYRLVKK